jgi:glycosyltransferase involved in cell wall biosynthesis
MGQLKILHALGQRPEKTGSGIYLRSIIKESQKQGFQNFLVAGIPCHKTYEFQGIPNDNCSYVRFESDLLNFPVTGMSDVMPYNSSLFKTLKGDRLSAYKKAFGQVLQQSVATFKPDIIHTHHLFLLSALTRKLFPSIPIVTTCHGTDLRQYNNCSHLRRFVKTNCQRLDRIIALTNDQRLDISRIYEIPLNRIEVIGGGYDQSIFFREPKFLDKTVQILYAGKFNRSKGVPWLLKSLRAISHHDWHLHMAGSGKGSEWEECLDLVKKLDRKVTVHGYISHKRLSELMKKCHIQVLPSFFEGLPLVIFEGLASGCRIITTNLSGFEEIFGKAKKDVIHLIPLPQLETIDRPYQNDEAMLANRLSQALVDMIAAVKKSPNFYDPHAENLAFSYTWQRIFERISRVYHEVLGR